MSLRLDDCTFFGPALPEPFVKFQLEGILQKKGLLPADRGPEGKALQERWDFYRRKLRELGQWGLSIKVANHVLLPLAPILRYSDCEKQNPVKTREGEEDGGWLMKASSDGSCLRAWSVEAGDDLDAPNRRGRAYRFSPSRVAQRVLLAMGERVGLLTDGTELRILICDPARPDSHISFGLDRADGWRAAKTVPDSFRLLLALTSPAGVKAVPELTEDARLAQSGVTKKLRLQARKAIEQFLQCVLDHPANREQLAAIENHQELAGKLWREGLTLVYRLLFTLKLESSPDPARAFSFSSTSLWRRTYSPSIALVRFVNPVPGEQEDTGGLLEGGLRTLFRLFCEGLASSEMKVNPLGGMLFGKGTTPLLDELRWGEEAVATLLRNLLWTKEGNKEELRRVYYGSLDVEDMGRVYEALLELEPGITSEPMCRLRRAKLEVVLPAVQGERYRKDAAPGGVDGASEEVDPTSLDELRRASGDEGDDGEDGNEEDAPARKGKTKVEWVEEIPAGRFYLRVGLGRKSSGSYYTPHPFVRFLVQETLEPQIQERSPTDNPQPGEILKLKVLDPAMGSGHFLVEACRYLGDHLYEACRQCDELASLKEDEAKKNPQQEESLKGQARELLQRVVDLPDPDDALVAYLPSRVAEGHESGLSLNKAKALCRRLVAVHCLYGVDKNPLAVELAKLAIWLESYAEGLPLTFMDHRLICGDSLTGPFFEHLLTFPGSGDPIEGLFTQGLSARLSSSLNDALGHVRDLEATVGTDVSDLELKTAAKKRLDDALAPFQLLAMAWSGGVMLGKKECDDTAYLLLLKAIADGGDWESPVLGRPVLGKMVRVGKDGVPYDLVFPEVFYPSGNTDVRRGFDAVVGNPPWDRVRPFVKEYLASFDVSILSATAGVDREEKIERLLADPVVLRSYENYRLDFERVGQAHDRLFAMQDLLIGGVRTGRGNADEYSLFAERSGQLVARWGYVGAVLPSAFHANEGATGVRKLYLEKMALKYCFSFENRKKLFDIDSRFKFAAVVAVNTGQPTDHFHCAFYLHELEWLFGDNRGLRYTLQFVRKTGGRCLTLTELSSSGDSETLAKCYETGTSFGDFCSDGQLSFGVYADMTRGAWRFTESQAVTDHPKEFRPWPEALALLRDGWLILHEGKTIAQYTDLWGLPPRFLVHVSTLGERQDWLRLARFYRLAYRGIASSTNERTAMFSLLSPGCVLGNSAPAEKAPSERPNAVAIALAGIMNSFAADFALRVRASANINQFVLSGVPLPAHSAMARFLAHSALRLSCNHAGYAPLWDEQVGDVWREPRAKHTWPVLEGDDERWKVRAAIDAVVADAYGLNREQYQHVLSTFSHKSYPKAPELCLAMFDELKDIGLDAFTKKYDPYWDLPLNENLPKPVIDIPGLEELKEEQPPTKKTGGRKGGMLFPVGDGPLFKGKKQPKQES